MAPMGMSTLAEAIAQAERDAEMKRLRRGIFGHGIVTVVTCAALIGSDPPDCGTARTGPSHHSPFKHPHPSEAPVGIMHTGRQNGHLNGTSLGWPAYCH